jgi:hypothetical protein
VLSGDGGFVAVRQILGARCPADPCGRTADLRFPVQSDRGRPGGAQRWRHASREAQSSFLFAAALAVACDAGGRQVHPETKARGEWWIRYADQHGQLRREKVGPKGLALDLYRKRKTEVREGRYFPPTKKRMVLFDEIGKDFLVYCKGTRSQRPTTRHEWSGFWRRLAGSPRQTWERRT